MSEGKRHISNAWSILHACSERSFVDETIQGLLDEIQRLEKQTSVNCAPEKANG